MRDPRRGSLRASYPVRPGRPLGVEPPPPLRLTQTTGASAGASLGSEGAAGSATWSRVDRGRIRRPRCAHGLDQVHCTCARERKGDLRPHRCSTSGLASVVIAPGCPRLPVPNAHGHLGTWTHDASARRAHVPGIVASAMNPCGERRTDLRKICWGLGGEGAAHDAAVVAWMHGPRFEVRMNGAAQ